MKNYAGRDNIIWNIPITVLIFIQKYFFLLNFGILLGAVSGYKRIFFLHIYLCSLKSRSHPLSNMFCVFLHFFRPVLVRNSVISSSDSLVRYSSHCAFHEHAISKVQKVAFTIAFFAAVNLNYDHKQRTLKRKNTQNGSKSTNHKLQT